MNAQKSVLERKKVRTSMHENLVKAQKPGHECTKLWTRTHESLDMNAQKPGHECTKLLTSTHESLLNAQQSENERKKV